MFQVKQVEACKLWEGLQIQVSDGTYQRIVDKHHDDRFVTLVLINGQSLKIYGLKMISYLDPYVDRSPDSVKQYLVHRTCRASIVDQKVYVKI